MNKSNKKNRIGVLNRTFVIIRVLEESRRDLNAPEISELSNINRTTCYRILQSLMSENIVEKGEVTGTYKLGTRLLKLGSIVQNRNDVRKLALPILRKLTEDTGDTSYLCILSDNSALCVERIEGDNYQLLILKVGDKWSLTKGAAPRAILSFLTDEKINEILDSPIEKNTPNTETDYSNFWNLIKETRMKGYSISDEDVVLGVASIGAPIFNHEGEVIASISLSSTVERLISGTDAESETINLLLGSAKKISLKLGWDESLKR